MLLTLPWAIESFGIFLFLLLAISCYLISLMIRTVFCNNSLAIETAGWMSLMGQALCQSRKHETAVRGHLLLHQSVLLICGKYIIWQFMFRKFYSIWRESLWCLKQLELVFCVSLPFSFFLLIHFPCVIRMYWSESDWLGKRQILVLHHR